MNNCLFSVIIPVFNAEKYLVNCIESILNQSYENFELLLVNDGSSDNSGYICDTYAEKDKRVKVFHTSNFGVSSARNLGLQNSSGEYILFVDADDWIEDGYILDFYNSIINYNFDLIVSGYHHDNLILKTNVIKSAIKEEAIINDDIAKILTHLEDGNLLSSVWGKLFKKELIDDCKLVFDTKISFGEDTLFTWSYLIHINSISVLGCIGYHYIQNNNLSSLTYKMDTYDNLMYTNNLIYNAKKRVSDKFKLSYNKIQHNFEIEYLMMEIRAVFSMYNLGYKKNRSFRIQKVKELSSNKNIKLMPNQTVFMKFIKLMLANKQYHIFDIVLLIKHRLIY